MSDDKKVHPRRRRRGKTHRGKRAGVKHRPALSLAVDVPLVPSPVISLRKRLSLLSTRAAHVA